MKRWILLAALLLLLSGCAHQSAPQGELAPPDDRILVLYTSHKEEVWLPIVKEFENRTGIFVRVETGGTNEMLSRIASESASPKADIIFGGGIESLDSYKSFFRSYLCRDADALSHNYRSSENLWTPFSPLPVVLIYNTMLVAPEALTGWNDLLSPRFWGQIAFSDPAISGSSFTALATMLSALGGSREAALEAFARQLDGRQLSSSGAVLTAVAEGSALVGITLEETALKRIAAGDPIALVYPREGTSCLPDGSAIIRNAPHEANAEAFMDFISSSAVQNILSQRFCRRPIRRDAEISAQMTPLESISVVEYNLEQVILQRDALLSSWAFYLGAEDGE